MNERAKVLMVTVYVGVCLSWRMAVADSDNPLVTQGIAAYHSGEFKKSSQILNRALESTKDKKTLAQVYLYLGLNHAFFDHKMLAELDFVKALKHDPLLKLDPDIFKPSLVRLFEDIKAKLREEISVAADQKDAVVSTHGKHVGKEINAITKNIQISEGLETLLRERRSKTIWSYSTLGVGLVCTVSMAVLYGVGFSERASAYDKYQNSSIPEEIEKHWDEVSTAHNKVVVGHVLLGTAVVALGLSTYHFLTRPSVPNFSAKRHIQLVLLPMNDSATLTLVGKF